MSDKTHVATLIEDKSPPQAVYKEVAEIGTDLAAENVSQEQIKFSSEVVAQKEVKIIQLLNEFCEVSPEVSRSTSTSLEDTTLKNKILDAHDFISFGALILILGIVICLKKTKNSSGIIALFGVFIIIISLMSARIIGISDGENMIWKYPSILLVTLAGMSFGVNLITDWLINNPSDQSGELRENKVVSLGKELERTTSERDRYKNELIKIQAQVSGSLGEASVNGKQSECKKKVLPVK
ncbi:MAG: hypothetical protein HRT73_13810 [Flavobacteriales bacterium]|nr:hypothetical protein [Flavobacteriales bacterium]